jgi:transposase InsO family protein
MTKTEERRMKVTDSVVKIFNESGQLYGSPKIAALINRSGEDKVSQKYVLGIMKKLGIKPKYIRHRTITTVSRNFSSELKNILHRHFNPEKPDAFWCTDITYIWTYDDGFVYLASVMDLYSRKIVGWCVTRTMDANVVLECIEMAKRRRGIDHPVVIHSDRGVQYTSEAYRKATE